MNFNGNAFNEQQNFNAGYQQQLATGQLNAGTFGGQQLYDRPIGQQQQQNFVAGQPNFHGAQAAQFEQPPEGWKPRVSKKHSYLKRKKAQKWHFNKKHHKVHSKIPLEKLRGKHDAISDKPLLEKKNGIAWTVVIEELLVGGRRGAIRGKQRHAIGVQPNFHGAQAAQFEQPPEGWKPRVSKKHSYLKRKKAQKWHFNKKHHKVHSKIPLSKLRRKHDAIGDKPLLEKKNGIAWTVEIQELLVVDRRPLKESTGQKLKRKAKEFAHAVVHPKETYKSVGHDERVVPLELQPAVAATAAPIAAPLAAKHGANVQAGGAVPVVPAVAPVVAKHGVNEQHDIRREHLTG